MPLLSIALSIIDVFIIDSILFQKYDRNSVLQIFLKSEGDDISSKYNKKDDREIENCYNIRIMLIFPKNEPE